MANVVPQLDFMQALKLSTSRLKDMTGRSRRSEFWWTILAVGVLNIILSFIPVVGKFLVIILWIATCPLMIRRMHDVGKGPGIVYAYLILYVLMTVFSLITYFAAKNLALGLAGTFGLLSTLVGIGALVCGIILIVFAVQDSQGNNQFGPSPKYPDGKPEIPAQQ
ncbi:MAG: DUF805 domain-containing protein [Bacteroidales bacterium]|nr:DUF805 domain-containing protein [Bacteroidales bacterium]MBR2136288.1 DUF805 domain-containing protein [Bacteroidales bacterium]